MNIIATEAFKDQKPGTSGLRKSVLTFQQPHYLENFVQSIFNALNEYEGGTLILGGDGRFFNRHAIQVILKMAAVNGVGRVLLGQHGILSTPAASCIIRKYKAFGGIILSASHNHAGIHGDFGIKYNTGNGAPADEKLTEAIYQNSLKLTHYFIHEANDSEIDLATCKTYQIANMTIEVINSIADYTRLMQSIFDFPRISQHLQNNFKICFDAMHAVTGPYAKEIFENQLKAPQGSVINAEPLEDFGGKHPDPNLIHAASLVKLSQHLDFAAASDGDGDRNMILGQDFFVGPSDSLAILAANAQFIPAFRLGLTGVARSMPTSQAVDQVAQQMQIQCFETPTGWKYFANLLDAHHINLCGEESFGTGSNHIREKDGIWAVLFWLNILAVRQESVRNIVHQHWQIYGRNYYCRYDFEAIPADLAEQIMSHLINTAQSSVNKTIGRYHMTAAEHFSYLDPVDKSESKHQGFRILLNEQARLIFRLSGTSTQNATLRIYIEDYEPDQQKQDEKVTDYLAELIDLALSLADLQTHLGHKQPTVIT